jgi:hypothetical protein
MTKEIKVPRGRPKKKNDIKDVIDAVRARKTAVDAEVVSETPPAPKPVAPKPSAPVEGKPQNKITITINEAKGVHLDIAGFSLYDAVLVLANSHKYLVTEINKRLALNDNEEGSADTASGSNT